MSLRFWWPATAAACSLRGFGTAGTDSSTATAVRPSGPVSSLAVRQLKGDVVQSTGGGTTPRGPATPRGAPPATPSAGRATPRGCGRRASSASSSNDSCATVNGPAGGGLPVGKRDIDTIIECVGQFLSNCLPVSAPVKKHSLNSGLLCYNKLCVAFAAAHSGWRQGRGAGGRRDAVSAGIAGPGRQQLGRAGTWRLLQDPQVLDWKRLKGSLPLFDQGIPSITSFGQKGLGAPSRIPRCSTGRIWYCVWCGLQPGCSELAHFPETQGLADDHPCGGMHAVAQGNGSWAAQVHPAVTE